LSISFPAKEEKVMLKLYGQYRSRAFRVAAERDQAGMRRPFAEGQDAVPIARAETDWEGRFVLEDVPACEEAWVEIDALYYLHYRGPSFSVPGGKDLDSGAVILHFGGSIDGEVVDGDGRR
jgi:hypothetical protein